MLSRALLWRGYLCLLRTVVSIVEYCVQYEYVGTGGQHDVEVTVATVWFSWHTQHLMHSRLTAVALQHDLAFGLKRYSTVLLI